MRQLILAAALILAAIIPAKSQVRPPITEIEKGIALVEQYWPALKADMVRADLAAGRKLRVDEHISRWFPFDPTTEHFDRLRMQRAGEVIR